MDTSQRECTDNKSEFKPWKLWLVTIIAVPMGIIGGSVFGYALGLPVFIIVWADIVAVVMLAVGFITGVGWQSPILTRRRAIVFFGVIPAICAVVAVVMAVLGFSAQGLLYGVSAVVVVGNLVYLLWFDKTNGSHEGSSASGPEV